MELRDQRLSLRETGSLLPARTCPAMRSLFLSLSLIFSLASQSAVAQSEPDPALRATLERAYENWRDAVIRKDARAWAAAITRYRQSVIRNSIVSERRSFPEDVFSNDLRPPALNGLRLLEAQAVRDTAHLVFFGRIDLGQDPELVKEDILKLKFLRDNGQWKFDSNRITSLKNAPDVLKTLREGGHPDFLDLPEYTPPGKAPPVPPLCRVPDYKAGYKLQSFGYATVISMNGFDYDVVQDGVAQEIIIGGLVNGHNEITLKITSVPVPKGAKATLELRLYRLSQDPSQPGREVLRWKAPESGAPAQVTLPIEIGR